MRVPLKMRPKARPLPRPVPFRSIKFVPCLRCMGHGHFQTDPPERVVIAVLTRPAALEHLALFLHRRRISDNQYAVTETQILLSNLPDEVPRELRQVVKGYVNSEEKVDALASTAENLVASEILPMDLVEVVHDFLLKSPAHADLKTQ